MAPSNDDTICRQCSSQPVYEIGAFLCDDCSEENQLIFRNKEDERIKIEKSGDKMPWIFGVLAVLLIAVLLFGSGSRFSENTESIDDHAYKEVRDRGYTETEARQMAPAIRQLCEQTGGKDCD